jgi:hypothetical protein
MEIVHLARDWDGRLECSVWLEVIPLISRYLVDVGGYSDVAGE